MRITFQFEGGFLDGRVIAGDIETQEPGDPVRRYVFLTHSGRVGSRFRDHPNHRETLHQPMSVFVQKLVGLGVPLYWLSRWFLKIERGDVSPADAKRGAG